MAEKDIAEKTFIALNDVFADIFNGLLFQGKQVMSADSLEELASASQYRAEDGSLHEQERDTHKLWHGHGINLVLAGIENQTRPDRDMPFRIISYDGASYRSQLLKTEAVKENGVIKQVPVKERYPVVTIVLYFGRELWTYPKNLCNCFYPELPDNEMTKELKPYIQDYKIHVFDIPRLMPEEVQQFQSDFRVVADYFVHAYVDKEYIPEDKVIDHVDEFLKLMKVLTGDNRYEDFSISLTEQAREDGVTMCEVLDFREKRGEARGEARVITLLSKLLEEGKSEIIPMITSDATVRAEYFEKYGI